jgi:hypothetical protein
MKKILIILIVLLSISCKSEFKFNVLSVEDQVIDYIFTYWYGKNSKEVIEFSQMSFLSTGQINYKTQEFSMSSPTNRIIFIKAEHDWKNGTKYSPYSAVSTNELHQLKEYYLEQKYVEQKHVEHWKLRAVDLLIDMVNNPKIYGINYYD